jgi:hypothetical protein
MLYAERELERISSLSMQDLYGDLRSDLVNLRKDVIKIINPILKDKISKRGLSIILNSVVGFDSEYELNSSLLKRNDLLSVQLAGTSGLVLKVPNLEGIEKIKILDLGLGIPHKNEKELCTIVSNSITELIILIRSFLYSNNDKLIKKLVKMLDETCDEGIKTCSKDDTKVYVFQKSSLKTRIRYTNTYSSEDLIKDSDTLNNKNHSHYLLKIISILNVVSGNPEISEKMKKSIVNSSNKPLSRITYKYNNSKDRLSVSINRILTICMHESAADLSMLSDFDTFKENLDILNRSFVTIAKPLKFDYCKSRVYFRDTVLLSPPGGQSLANIGSIYGDEYKKIDIGEYRSGKMKDLLQNNKELFEKYAIQDSIITWKHATSMEDFNLEINQVGIPLTVSSISKNYILNE